MITSVIYYIAFIFYINVCEGKKYTNYTLFRAIPVNASHLEFFSSLDEYYDVNFWRPPATLRKAIDFVISPLDEEYFLREADKQGVYLTTIINDVQKAFDKQTVKSYIRRQMSSFDWNNYFRLNDIYTWLKDLAKIYSDIMEVKSIGKSHENRDIMSVKILLKGRPTQKPKVIIEGGIHAREWIAPAFVTYLIDQIIHANVSEDQNLKEVAYAYEWYFVPVLNVDGYEYTHTTDRLWRKNRNGFGVDLNRNFAHAFGSTGVSFRKQSDLYCGETAFSESESKAMSDFVKSKSQFLEYYVAFHSYGQYMILPYANSKKHLENFDDVFKMCTIAAEKISQRYNTVYEVGTAYDTVGYTSSGVSGCWVKSALKVPFVVTFELRDIGYDGFALHPSKILPTCIETMDGLLDLFSPPKKIHLYKLPKSQADKFSEPIVIFFNVLAFIIVRFD